MIYYEVKGLYKAGCVLYFLKHQIFVSSLERNIPKYKNVVFLADRILNDLAFPNLIIAFYVF